MGKFVCMLLAAVLLVFGLTACGNTGASEPQETTLAARKKGVAYSSGDYYYMLLDDNTAEIIVYTGSDTKVEIPSALDGYTVTSVGDYAFYNFNYNGSYYSVTPNGDALDRENGEANITSQWKIWGIEDTNYDRGNLTNVKIPNSVTSIGDSAFGYCSSLTSITIPHSVTTIDSAAFEYCTSLTNITVPNNVTTIGSDAFQYCINLANITVPDSVTDIGENALYDTAWYNSQPDGVVYIGKVAYDYKGDMPENTSITLADGTKGIAEKVFYSCDNLVSMTIPDGITSIGEDAFRDCENLVNISIPDSVTSIGDYAFNGCTSLVSITVPKSVERIGEYALGYTETSGFYDRVKTEGFTIYGSSGSAAESYANEYGFTFVEQ